MRSPVFVVIGVASGITSSTAAILGSMNAIGWSRSVSWLSEWVLQLLLYVNQQSAPKRHTLMTALVYVIPSKSATPRQSGLAHCALTRATSSRTRFWSSGLRARSYKSQLRDIAVESWPANIIVLKNISTFCLRYEVAKIEFKRTPFGKAVRPRRASFSCPGRSSIVLEGKVRWSVCKKGNRSYLRCWGYLYFRRRRSDLWHAFWLHLSRLV